MTTEEKMMFTSLLFAHRHLWMTFQEYRYLQERPDVDWEAAHEIFHEESDVVYNSLAEAVREGKPLQDKFMRSIPPTHRRNAISKGLAEA